VGKGKKEGGRRRKRSNAQEAHKGIRARRKEGGRRAEGGRKGKEGGK
jgi:hypothetical protein